MTLLDHVVIGLWFILPAYVGNMLAPVAHGRTYMDGGRKLYGQPLFGKGKTWEGFLFGIFCGIVTGAIQIAAYPHLTAKGFVLPQHTLVTVAAVSFGALFGDLAAAFLKRRAKIPRGYPVPFLDQLDFAVGALVLVSPFIKLPLATMAVVLAFTPLVHLTANLVGYKLGHKKEPW